MNSSAKAGYVPHLSEALTIQLNIFKCVDGISEKFIPSLSIDEEILLWVNKMVVSGVIYHEENSLIVDIIHQELTWIIRDF